jgi:hypothetical protein
MRRVVMTQHAVTFIALVVCLSHTLAIRAQDQIVQLPHVFSDDTGSSWDVQFDGSIGDGGNDLYDGGGRLFINSNTQYQSPNQQATLDVARNELTFPPTQINGLNISRKVAVLASLSTVRFTEIVENPTGATIKIQLRCYFNLGGSVQQAIPLVDAKHPQQSAGYALGDQNNGIAMIAAARSSKIQPRFNFRTNDDNIDIFYDLDVPAHQTIAVVHCQLRRHTVPDAADAWKSVSERDLLQNMPRDLRRRVINFPSGDSFIGDLEILRGDALDIVELRGGDTYRGNIKIDHFRLQTLYGPVLLPVEKVVGLINIGLFHPSQLIITTDGQTFGGRLDFNSVKLQLTSGQLTTIPLSQITRLGYRKRFGEPDEWDLENKTVAYLRGGERVRVKLPTSDFNLATPSGPIRLNPRFVSSIVFQGQDNNVPEVHLIDGTHLSALLGASNFDMTLLGLGAEQPARMTAAALLRFHFAPEQETTFLTSTFTLANQDELIGTIGGTLSLETPFDTLHIEGPQIKQLIHARGGDHDVQITLWDDSTLSGRLVESHVTCLLKCGLSLRVPITLIEHYQQPLPLPSSPMIDRIKQTARDLDSDNWTIRDQAQSQLIAIGPSTMAVLKQIRAAASVEAAQRIDLIVNQLSADLEASTRVGAPAAPVQNNPQNEVFMNPPAFQPFINR